VPISMAPFDYSFSVTLRVACSGRYSPVPAKVSSQIVPV
jgi:hypothetical protein